MKSQLFHIPIIVVHYLIDLKHSVGCKFVNRALIKIYKYCVVKDYLFFQ